MANTLNVVQDGKVGFDIVKYTTAFLILISLWHGMNGAIKKIKDLFFFNPGGHQINWALVHGLSKHRIT